MPPVTRIMRFMPPSMMKALRSRGLSLIAQESFVERFDRFVAAVGFHWKPTLDDPLTLLKEFKVRSADFGRHQAQTVGLRTHFEPLRQSVAVGRGKGRTTVGHGQDIGANGTAVDGRFRYFRQTDAFHLGTNGFHLTADFASQCIESAIVGGFAFELRHALRLQDQMLLILS